MKYIKLAAHVAAALLAAIHVQAQTVAPAGSPSSAPALVADSPTSILSVLTTDLGRCRMVYIGEQASAQESIDSYRSLVRRGTISNVELVQWTEDARKKAAAQPKTKACTGEVSGAFPDRSRRLVASVAGSGLEDRVKDLLAQWMTTMDATSNATFDQEYSKYNTLANRIKLELSLK